MSARELSSEDLNDIVHGAAVYGSGGGGPIAGGQYYMKRALETGNPIRLIPFDKLSPEDYLCSPFFMGAIPDVSKPRRVPEEYARLPLQKSVPVMNAVRLLEKEVACPIRGIIPAETGAFNVGAAFYVAAMTGTAVVDGDPLGRSVPEVSHSNFSIMGLPTTPLAAVNLFGEAMLLHNVLDGARIEKLLRAICMASADDMAVVDHAMPFSQLRCALIPGMMSKCLELGRKMRLARMEGNDVANSVAEGSGKVVFRGVVNKFETSTEGGFTIGNVEMYGSGVFDGQVYRIEFKNENMSGWLDGHLHVTVPEIICIFDVDSGEVVLNPEHRVGMNAAVTVLPAPKPFLTKKGLEAFGPRYLGLDTPFKPLLG